MYIVYNKENKIVSSLLSNNTIEQKNLKQMFSSDDFCFVELTCFPEESVIGGIVEKKDEVVFKIIKNNKTLFELDEKTLSKKIDASRKEKIKSKLEKFPCNIEKISIDSFLERISSIPQTEPNIRNDLLTGEYFDNSCYQVGWWGCFTDAGGYANMNREITKRLHNYNVIPYVRVYKTIPQVEQSSLELIELFSKLSPKNNDHPFVYAYTPMPHSLHNGKRIFFTMMETYDLHNVFSMHCNKYSDEVWVPSQSNKEIFINNGVKKNIKVTPLGIDEAMYFGESNNKKLDLKFTGIYGKDPSEGVNGFKFLSVIQWNFRKGYDALIKSFVNAFDDKDDVCLVITTQYPLELVRNDLNEFLPRENNLPQVLLYNDVIKTNDMPNYYKNFNCYIHLSRGEGFSLTQIEAAACGLPVISCNNSGMTEYLTDENSFRVECPDVEKCPKRLESICYFYQNRYLWKLGKKQVEQAVDYMRYVFDDYGSALKKADVFYNIVKNKYTWKNATKRIAELLKI